MMYPQSQFIISPMNDDVTVVENILSERHCNTDLNHVWNSDLYPEPIQNYQTHQWNQEAQATSLNSNLSQSLQEPNIVYQNLPVINSVGYQQAICYDTSISHVYSSDPSRHMFVQNTLKEENFHQQILPCNLIQQGSFDNTQKELYHRQINYINKRAGLKSMGKRKRKRTMFTTEQVAVLEKVFLSKPYINRDERQALVEELQINDKVIKVWFQNRRLKEKRQTEEAAQELYSTDAEETQNEYKFDKLSYVESQINHADKFGYVTLDNRAINELVSVIDKLLSQKTEVDLTEENHDDVVSNKSLEEGKSSSCTIYEPISPASSECTSSEESTSYEPFEPKETLQRIFDIQEFLVFKKKECSQQQS